MSYNNNQAYLAGKVYKINKTDEGSVFTGPNGSHWLVVKTTDDHLPTGYQAALVKNLDTGKYEMVSRGTEFDREPLKDGGADLQMGLGKLPDQMQSARDFLDKSKDQIIKDGGNPNTDLSLVGHSLGGSVTQVLGAENPQLPAVAFNPYGVGNLIPEGNYSNVSNHVMAQDPVSVLPGSKMVGSTTMYTEPGNRYGDTALTLNSHFASNFLQPEVLAQSGKTVTIDVTPNALKPLEPIHIVNPFTEIAEGRLDPNTLLPKQPQAPSPADPNHSTDYNFSDTAGAGRGTVNPDVVAPTEPPTVFNPTTALPSYSGDHAITVQPGDTVSSIAKRYDMTAQEFSAYLKDQYGPNADLNSIVAGRKLPIPEHVYERTLGGTNGHDLPPEPTTPPSSTNAPASTSDAHQQVLDAFGKADTTAADLKTQYPGVQVADASGGLPNTLNPHSFSNYLDTQAGALTPQQQTALAAQLDKLGLGGESDLSFHSLPGGGALIANADGDIVGELVHSSTGDLNLRATAIDASGNAVEVNQHISESGQSLSEAQYNAATQQQASAMFNSLMTAGQWDNLSDLGKFSALVNLYNATDKLGEAFGASGDNLPGDLGSAAGWLSLAQGIENGDGLVIANAVNILSDRALDNALDAAFSNSAAGEAAGEAVPYLSYALAIRNFADNPEQAMFTAAGTYVGEAFGAAIGGPIGAAIGGAIGGMIGGMIGGLFGDDDPPPPPEGVVHFSWDASGHIQHTVDFNQSGGGDAADSVADSVQGLLEQVVTSINTKNPSTADDVAINPYLLPKIGFSGSSAWMEVSLPDGSSMREGINPDSFAQRLLEILQDNGGIAPAWQVQTEQAKWLHAQDQVQQLQAQRDALQETQTVDTEGGLVVQTRIAAGQEERYSALSAQIEQAQAQLADLAQDFKAGIGGQAHAGNTAYSLQGDAAESADFQTQSFGTLVVHLGSDPALQASIQAAQSQLSTQLTQVLRDVEGDGYLESTESLAAKDGTGHLQALLTIDFNGDGIVQTRDILNLGGNKDDSANLTDQARLANQNADLQRNNVQWLDANSDGVLDKSDPAFAAIRLWVDINQDGVQQADEASSALSQHIASIDFKTGQVTYEDGHTDALTAQTLQADTEGVKLTQIKEVNPDGSLSTLDAGDVLEHEGYQGQVQITDDGGTRWVKDREQTFEQQAKRTGDWEGTAEQDAHRHGGSNVEGAPTETTATGASDLGPVKSQANVATRSTVEQGDARVVSDAPVQQGTQAAPQQPNATTTINASDSRIKSNPLPSASSTASPTVSPVNTAGTAPANTSSPLGTRMAFVPTTQATVQNELKTVTEDMIASSQSMLFGAGASAGLGVLAAVGMGATQSAQAAEQRPALASEVLANQRQTATDTPSTPVSSNNTFITNPSTPANSATDVPAVTFRQVDLGVVNVVPMLPATPLNNAPSYTPSTNSSPNAGAPVSEPIAPANGPLVATLIVTRAPQAVAAPPANTTANATPPSSPQQALAPSSVASALAPTLDYPVVQAETIDGTEDVVLRLPTSLLLANDSTSNASADPNQPALTITAVSAPQNGLVSLADGEVVFFPDPNFHGTASFVYTVTDQYGLSSTATATLQIAAVNDVPVTQGERFSGNEDVELVFTQAQLLTNDSDVDSVTDGQVLRIARVGQAEHGTVHLDLAGAVHFIPDANYHGPAQFTYWVSDGPASSGAGAEVPTTATLTIAAVNDAPIVNADVLAGTEDTTLLIDAATLLDNDSDVDSATDGQVLRIDSVSTIDGQTHGTVSLLTLADGSQQVRFVPEANFHGTATFSYAVSDGNGGLVSSTASVNVAAVNDAPVTQGESASTNEDTRIVFTQAQLLANDSDVDVTTDGQVLRISAVNAINGATHGTVSLQANGDIWFVPDANYHGPSQFSYTVSDGNGGSTQATVSLNVSAVNDAPIVNADVLAGTEDTALLIDAATLLANDSDVDSATDGQVLRIDSVSTIDGQTHGTVSLLTLADGSQQVRFVPEANFHGTATFSYAVSDGNGGLVSSTASVHVAAVNDAPITTEDVALNAEDTAIVWRPSELLANDSDVDSATDGQVLHISRVGEAEHGQVMLLGDGSIRFVPEANYHGPAQFTYWISDGSVQEGAGAEVASSVKLTVTSVNDAPIAVGDVFAAAEDTTTVLTTEQLLDNDTDNDSTTDGDVLAVTRVFAPSHCTVTLNADGTISLTPEANYHGNVRFGYEITDQQGATSVAYVVAGVNAINDAPVAMNDSFSSLEDEVLTLNQADVLANDSDEDIATDGDVIRVTSVGHAQHGQVRMLDNGQIEFVPDLNFHGTASFECVVSDSFGASSTSTVTLTVGAVNDLPVVLNERDTVIEDVAYTTTAAALLGNDSDVDSATDGQTLSVTQVLHAQHGVVSMAANGVITFTPDADFHGTASFDYMVSDGNGGLTSGKVTLDVQAVNDAPMTQGESATTDEDTRIVFTQAQLLANDSDVDVATDGQVLRISAVNAINGATHGTVSLQANGDIWFVPETNYHGHAQFSYTVSDGNGGSTQATVSLSVTAVNDAPVVNADVLAGTEDTTLLIDAATLLANDSDVDSATDGQVLRIDSVSAIDGQTHGTVSLVTLADGSQQVRFAPEANFHGTATFSYAVSDGNGGLVSSTASVNVAAVNDAPLTQGEQATTDEDTRIVFTQVQLLANDSDADVATDGQVLRISAVNAINGATHGTVSLQANGDIWFVPEANYHGPAQFSYTVSDGNGGSTAATVSLTVTAVNDAPIVNADVLAGTEDTALLIDAATLLANDSDVDTATDGQVLRIDSVSTIDGQTHGAVSLVTLADGSQQVRFVPETNFHGTATFSYAVSDGNGGLVSSTASVNVAAVNDAPVTQGETATSDEDMGLVFTPTQLLANDSDVDTATDGQVLSISRVGQAEHGTVWLDAQGHLRFVPEANYHGPAQFTYWASDGNGAETPATVGLTIAAVNDVPVAQGESTNTQEDTTLYIAAATLLANDSDADTATDGQVLSISGLSPGVHCSVSLSTLPNGSQRITFVPEANYHGTATFDYTVSDGQGGTAVATAVVNLAAVNDAPAALGEVASGDEDATLAFSSQSLLANDSDVDTTTDDQVLRIGRVGDATHGTVSLDALGQVRFTPGANYHGPAQFTYWVSDGAGAEAPATVSLNILAVNDLPMVTGETLSTNEDTTLLFNPTDLLANDWDADGATDGQVLRITAVGSATHGTVAFVTQSDGSQRIAFTPEANYFGVASYQYTVSDGAGGSTEGTVVVNLASTNDTPVANNDNLGNTAEDTPLRINVASLLGNDTDADSADAQWGGINELLTVTAVGQAQHGSVALVGNEVVFTPDANHHGAASFAYQITDSRGAVSQAVASFNVTAVNDAPVAVGETISSQEDTTLTISQAALLQNDSDVDSATDGQVLNIISVSNASNGSVTLNANGSISFVPNLNFYGDASFDYTISDGNGGTATARATVLVSAVNDAPVGTGETIYGQEDQALTIAASTLLQNDGDVDNAQSSLTISRVQSGTGGTATLNASGNVEFTPTANYNGTATFTYWVKDPAGLESNAVTTTVVLAAVNDAPSAQGEIVTGASEDAVFNISKTTLLANDHDIDDADSALSLSWVGNASSGTVSLDAYGNVVFTPTANFNENASFQYKVRDAAGLESPVVTAVIPVAAVNDAPLTVDDQFSTYRNSTMTIGFGQLTGNDSDVEGDALTVSAVRDHANGHASIVNGQVQFVATTGFTGTASFDYLADDGHGGQTWGTAYVGVILPPNQYPQMSVTQESAQSGPYWSGSGISYSAGYYMEKLVVTFNISDDGPGPFTIELITARKYSFYGVNWGMGSASWDGWYDGISNTSLDMINHMIIFSVTGSPEKGFNQYQTSWKITDEQGVSNIWHYDVISYQNYQLTSTSYNEHSGYYTPPIVLDLNNDVIHFTSLANSNVAVDINHDGIADKMAWAGNDDGVLVWDKDHNRQITDASEFGFQTLKAGAQTDLEGLQALDSNDNGLLDAGDEKFAEFAVWQDANGNGITDAGEFKTLTEWGIASIGLKSDGQMRQSGTALANSGSGETDAVVMGNATFTRTDGSTGTVADTMLAYEPGQAPEVAASTLTTALVPEAPTDTTSADAQIAEVVRQAWLFNQVCNTAIEVDNSPLGFIPIAPNEDMANILATAPEGAHSLMQPA